MEIIDCFLHIFEVGRRFPSLFMSTIALPLDFVLEFPPEYSRVYDLLYFIFEFLSYDFWWWAGIMGLSGKLGSMVRGEE